MEHLFSTRGYRDEVESQGRLDPPEWLRELELDVSTEELLSAERAFTYADLFAMLENGETVARVTPHASVVCAHGSALTCAYHNQSLSRFSFSADGKEIVALARSTEDLLEICDVVLRVLAASVVHSVILRNWSCLDSFFINSAGLAYLMEHCQSLKALTLEQIALDENHCRVLGAYSRPDLDIELIRCTPTSAGTSALVKVLGRNQGPTKLEFCDIDYSVLAGGMRGNSRLKSLTPRVSINPEKRDREVFAIASALRENKGLIELKFGYDGNRTSDETWGAICDSFKTHPTLQVLHLWSAVYEGAPLAPAVLEFRIQALLDMLKMNLSIHTIHLDSCSYGEHEIFRGSVIPYLETNRLRPRILAIQKILPIAYRAKVLGRALLATRTDANSIFMLLSGNPEVAFPSTAAATTPAAKLPAPAAAATTFTATANVAAAVAASVMSALTANMTGFLPAALPLLLLLLFRVSLSGVTAATASNGASATAATTVAVTVGRLKQGST
jgi:hypothetical protein